MGVNLLARARNTTRYSALNILHAQKSSDTEGMGITGLTTHQKWPEIPSSHPMMDYMGSMQRSFCVRSQLERLAKLTTYSLVREPNGYPEVMPVRKTHLLFDPLA